MGDQTTASLLVALALSTSACSLLSLAGLSGGDSDAENGGTDSLTVGEDRIRAVTETTTVVTGEAAPRGIAVTSRSVVWASSGDKLVRRLGFGETTPRTIGTLKGLPIDVLADGDDVYVHMPGYNCNDPGAVERLREDGSGQKTFVSECQVVPRLGLDPASVLYVATDETSNGTVSKVVIAAKDPGTSPTTLPEARNKPSAIVGDGTRIYWVRENTKTIMSAPKTSDASLVQLFATSPSKPVDLALDADTVYWIAEAGEVLAGPKSSPGATPIVIATGEGSPTRIATSGGYVYWTATGTGLVRRARKPRVGGGEVETIAKDLNQPFGIAVASDAVWVTTRSGSIVRIGLAP